MQYQLPILRKPINLLAQLVVRYTGRIQSGCGAGLKFDGRGCFPGYALGTSDPIEQNLLVSNLKSGDVFYDLGANAGFYCIIAARVVGSTGKVYAFEPTPSLAARIRKNAASNGFGQIEVIESAITDRTGKTAFGIVGDNVTNSIGAAARVATTINVPTITVDDFAKTNPPPSLILMDVEGVEIEALQGAIETIKQHRPTLMVEVHWLGSKFQNFIDETLYPLGYVAETYDGQPIPIDPVEYHCLLRPRESQDTAK